MSWTEEQIEQFIQNLEGTEKNEFRNQRIENLIDDIPLDQDKIIEIKRDIDELWSLGYDYLSTGRKVTEIRKIIEKYRLKKQDYNYENRRINTAKRI